LDEHGERPDAHTRHSVVYRDMFRVPDWVVADQRAAGLRLIEPFVVELDNVRAALAWSLESGDTATAIELGAVAAFLFINVGYLREQKRWLDRVLAATSEASPHRARALTRAIWATAALEGPDRVDSLVDELEDTVEVLDDEQWRAACIERRAVQAMLRDDLDAASALFEEAAEHLLRLDHPESAYPLNNNSEMLFWTGHYEEADAVAERAAHVGRRFNVPHAVARALRDRSYIAVNRGDPDAAERYLAMAEGEVLDEGRFGHAGALDPTDRALVIRGFIALLRARLDEAEQVSSVAVTTARRTREPDSLFGGLVLAGLVHLHRDDVAAAHRVLTEALREATRLRLRYWQRYILGPFAAATALRVPVQGAVLLGAVEADDRRHGRVRSFPVARAVEHAVVELRQSLGANDLADAWHRGTAMTLDDAIAHALQPSQVTPHSQA
jgi:ATP/maltotriose-dependent transcriptional regulator MalT